MTACNSVMQMEVDHTVCSYVVQQVQHNVGLKTECQCRRDGIRLRGLEKLGDLRFQLNLLLQGDEFSLLHLTCVLEMCLQNRRHYQILFVLLQIQLVLHPLVNGSLLDSGLDALNQLLV